jgi:two-component system, OmpR family, sensor histidine kinase QseC
MNGGGRPSTLRARVALTVVGAFAVVFVVLFLVLWREALSPDSGHIDRVTREIVHTAVRTLDRTNSDDAAQVAVGLLSEALLTGLEPGEPSMRLLAQKKQGGVIAGGRELGTLDPQTLPDGWSAQNHSHGTWRIYALTGEHWKVAAVDDSSLRTRWLSRQLGRDLATYLGLALPIVLLPVWWIVWIALKPLTSLSQAVAARSPSDTTPLPTTKRWRELLPLEDALNRLFERTSTTVMREKAFVHDAAHELRTPLALINAQAQLLVDSDGAAREQAKQLLQSAVARASHVTQQLLRLAQADAATQSERSPVDLMNLARDAMALQSEQAAKQSTELDLQGPDHFLMQSDPRALRSILDNLIDNALLYGGPGGVVLLRVHNERDHVALSVSDQGPGIAKDDQEKVFERFWRGKTTDQRGTGLGLAIVREAARSLGGRAWVSSGPPGATITVRLPLLA